MLKNSRLTFRISVFVFVKMRRILEESSFTNISLPRNSIYIYIDIWNLHGQESKLRFLIGEKWFLQSHAKNILFAACIFLRSLSKLTWDEIFLFQEDFEKFEG